MTRLVSVVVGGVSAPWESLGLSFSDSACDLGGVRLEVSGAEPGITGWQLAVDPGSPGARGEVDIDGIATVIVEDPGTVDRDAGAAIGSQRIVGVDHVVVNTDDPDRTCAVFGRVLGLEVRRTRDAGNGVEQRFFRLDNSIIEVVSGPHTRSAGSASLWGLVISVDDLFDLAEALGPEVVSPPKRAVQPGRFISTVRGSVGLGLPFAMMTPHYSSSSPSPDN